MELPIVSIGNSKGIRLPKSVLAQYGFTEFVELILDKGQIILRPKSAPRSGWDQAFAQMHADGADALLLPENLDNDHLEEW